MTYVLRKYQDEATVSAVEFFSSVNRTRPIIMIPTGGGKSIIIAHVVKQLKGNILILQPSVELLKQNYEKYDHVIKDHPELEQATIYSAGAGSKERGRVAFATIGSIYKTPELFSEVRYVIIDECHFVPPDRSSMYMKFLAALDVQVLGLTATPYRLKTYNDPWQRNKKFSKINLLNRERPQFFNTFLHITHTKQLYDEGFLCPINYIEMKWDGSALRVNSTGAEYSDKSLKEAIERNEILKKIPPILDQAFKKGRKACLVFVRSVEEARQLASVTPFSDYLFAEMNKKDRANIVKNFKAGNLKTVFNVGILTTGFDYPELDTIILARPTMSLTLYVQMIGRGMRPAPGKEKVSVLDMCGNIKRFGKVEELRVEFDERDGWVLRNERQVLSGRPLDELV